MGRHLVLVLFKVFSFEPDANSVKYKGQAGCSPTDEAMEDPRGLDKKLGAQLTSHRLDFGCLTWSEGSFYSLTQ